MKKVIHRLRQRPHHERRAIAAGTALSLTAVLFVGWSAFFLNSLSGANAPTNVAATEAALEAKVAQPVVVTPPSYPPPNPSVSTEVTAPPATSTQIIQ